ncbi:unnamed protein product, partial [Larinioides sclopetarius]
MMVNKEVKIYLQYVQLLAPSCVLRGLLGWHLLQ